MGDIAVGSRVRVARSNETGTVREFVDTKKGRRALVRWRDEDGRPAGEQFVDVAKLVLIEKTKKADLVPVTNGQESTGSTPTTERECNSGRQRSCAMATFDRCVLDLGIRQEVP